MMYRHLSRARARTQCPTRPPVPRDTTLSTPQHSRACFTHLSRTARRPNVISFTRLPPLPSPPLPPSRRYLRLNPTAEMDISRANFAEQLPEIVKSIENSACGLCCSHPMLGQSHPANLKYLLSSNLRSGTLRNPQGCVLKEFLSGTSPEC